MLTASHPHCVSLNRAATARRSTFQKSQTRRAALIAIPRRILISCPTEGTQAADKGPSATPTYVPIGASLRHPSTYREYASGCRGARRLAAGPFSTACDLFSDCWPRRAYHRPSSLLGVQELPPRHPVPAQKIAEHHARRQEVAREDGPPGDGLEQPVGQRQDHGKGEDLEAAEEHDEGEEHARRSVGQREQGARDPSEEDEGHALDGRVLDHP